MTMCTEKHWELCNNSAAFHAATRFALALEETAKQQGFKPKTIKIRTKEQIIKGGFGKSDAQVIWKEGPEDWATNISASLTNDIDYIVEKDTVSFYTR
jgi:hypothetical protein